VTGRWSDPFMMLGQAVS